jgi:hypothetical protein
MAASVSTVKKYLVIQSQQGKGYVCRSASALIRTAAVQNSLLCSPYRYRQDTDYPHAARHKSRNSNAFYRRQCAVSCAIPD